MMRLSLGRQLQFSSLPGNQKVEAKLRSETCVLEFQTYLCDYFLQHSIFCITYLYVNNVLEFFYNNTIIILFGKNCKNRIFCNEQKIVGERELKQQCSTVIEGLIVDCGFRL